jgi:hypothetical protein
MKLGCIQDANWPPRGQWSIRDTSAVACATAPKCVAVATRLVYSTPVLLAGTEGLSISGCALSCHRTLANKI